MLKNKVLKITEQMNIYNLYLLIWRVIKSKHEMILLFYQYF